jgi:hypothetical protein
MEHKGKHSLVLPAVLHRHRDAVRHGGAFTKVSWVMQKEALSASAYLSSEVEVAVFNVALHFDHGVSEQLHCGPANAADLSLVHLTPPPIAQSPQHLHTLSIPACVTCCLCF